MSQMNSVMLLVRGLTLALAIIAAAGHSAEQAPAVSYTTYSGPSLTSINWVTAGPDGALWFTGSSPTKAEIGRITTTGAITEYPISNTPTVIVTGPDGALWFAERNVHQIGRITTGGSITEYPAPAEAEWITSGPDGALWFTERNAVNIGRITTTGMVTEYPLPSLNPNGAIVITVGPDGALWFTDSSANKVGRITTTGVATEYDLPLSDGFLDSLMAGPDGALWYGTFAPGVIGRMTTGGTITAEYPFGALPYDLTVGPDGALWFISASVDGGDIALAQITTAGAITEYGLPVSLPAGGSSITKGPDNALWIAGGGTPTLFGTTPATFVRVAVGSGPAITSTSLPAGTVGSPYSGSLSAQGGTPPYTWSVIGGSLPAGLTLNPATGAIAGTPTSSGTSFTVKVTDSSNPSQSGTQALSISISSPSSTYSIASSPTGLAISVDGVPYIAPQSFTCTPGTQHTLAVTSPQGLGIFGSRYSFTGWSDGVSSSIRQITCASTATTYTANFITQYLLTEAVAPAGAGSITANPSSADGFYNSGTAVQLTASTNFVTWSGDLSGLANPQTIVMNGPKSVTANFGGPPPPCTFSLTSSEMTLSQFGTASTGGVLPQVPISILAAPTSGSGFCSNFTASSSDAWLNAMGGTSGFSFTALTNPHPTARSASIVVGNVNGGNAVFTVTEAGNPEALLNRQVRALYQSILGRDPDAGGFAFWTGIGSTGLGQMLDSFLTSPEAFNIDFVVMATYQAATGSAPNYTQFAATAASIRAGTTIGTLFNSLISSSYTAQNLYQNLLNRAPLAPEITSANAAGLAAWFQTLIQYPSSTTPVTAPNNEFMSTGTFHAGADHTNGLYIAMLYYVILGRNPDQGGYNFWLGVANSGGPGILFQGWAGYPTRIQIVGPGTPSQGFAGSPEFQGLYQ